MYLLDINVFAGANYFIGDGSPRTEQAAHALLLMIHHTFTRRPRVTVDEDENDPGATHLTLSLDTHKEHGSTTTNKVHNAIQRAQSRLDPQINTTPLGFWLTEQKKQTTTAATNNLCFYRLPYQSPSCRYCSLENFLEYFTCSCLSVWPATAAKKTSSNWTTKRLHLGKPLLFSFFGVNWGTMGTRRAERLRRTLFGRREIPEFNPGISEQLFLSLSLFYTALD
jgi:hypothetical protein